MWKRTPKIPVLLVISVIAFLVRVVNLNYNSPFSDEAQYIVLGRKVIAGHWQEETPFSWVGGMPLFYPALSAVFASFGGVVGARFLNVLLGSLAVYLLYHAAKELNLFKEQGSNERLGWIAALLLALSAIPIHLSRLATYDMLSFTLFLAGLLFWQRILRTESGVGRRRETSVFLAALFFVLAFLAKYIVLVFFFPILFVSLIRFKMSDHGDRRRLARYFFLPIILGIGVYLAMFFPSLQEFLRNQVKEPQNQAGMILSVYQRYTLWSYLLAIAGSLMVFRRRPLLVIALLGGSLVVPAAHLAMNNSASVYQHAFLSLLFLLPLASVPIIEASKRDRRVGYLLIALATSVLFSASYRQVRALESAWHDSRDVMQFLRERLAPQDRILTQEGDVTVLALSGIPQDRITGPFWFEYQGLERVPAYQKALADGFFTSIQLTTDAHGEFLSAVQSGLTDQYQLIYDRHPYLVYRRL